MWNISGETLFNYAFILVITFPFLMLIRQLGFKFIELKRKELSLLLAKEKENNIISQARLQAYERMVIFLERIRPSNLIQKFDKELNVKEFVFLIDKSIKEEFEYNISQQLYIEEKSWEDILNSKNNILQLLHKILEINPNISLQEFSTIFLVSYLEGEDYITHSIDNLKKDIQYLILK